MTNFDEEGIRKRFLSQYSKLKAKYHFKNKEFGAKIGHSQPEYFITALIKNKQKISLEIIMRTYHTFPNDINLDYILLSKEVPSGAVVSLQGEHFKHLKSPGPKGYAGKRNKDI